MTVGEMKLFLKRLGEEVDAKRITELSGLVGEKVVSAERAWGYRDELDVLVFFESGRWFGFGLMRSSYASEDDSVDWEYIGVNLESEAKIFADAGVITAEQAALAKEYTQTIKKTEQVDHERRLYERLKEKFA